MKKINRLLGVLLSVLLLCSTFFIEASAEAYTQDDFVFELNSETQEAQLTAYNGTATDVIIPNSVTVGDVIYKVTSVADNVFTGTAGNIIGTGDSVTSIVFPENVITIGENACKQNVNLTSVTINGSGVILNKAFASGCTSLSDFKVNGYVKILSEAALANTNITTLVFPEGLEAVYNYGLYISALKSLTLPSTLTTVEGEDILTDNLNTLKAMTIYVPDTATEAIVREGCKSRCTIDNVKEARVYRWKIIVGDGYESDPGYWKTSANQTHTYSGSAQKVAVPTYSWEYLPITSINKGFANGTAIDIIIPETISLIDGNFTGNATLEKVTINSVIAASYIFNNCSALKEATIKTVSGTQKVENVFMNNPELAEVTVTGIIPEAFDTSSMVQGSSLPKFKKLVITETGGFDSTVNGPNYQFNGAKSIIEELEVHGKITKSNCFFGYSGLKTIKIYNTASISGVQTFRGCTGVTGLIIEANTTIDSGNTFQGCTALKELILEDGVTFTSYANFNQCTNLTTVTAKSGVSALEPNFQSCTSLKHIIVPNGIAQINFANTTNTNLVNLYMPNWIDGMRFSDACATDVRNCLIPEGTVLTDIGEEYLVPSREGYIFCGFSTTVDGKIVKYDLDRSQDVKAFRPILIRPNGGDVTGDGNVDILDLIRYKKKLIGTLSEDAIFVEKLADFNEDKLYNSADLTALRQILFGSVVYSEALSEQITFAETLEPMSMEDGGSTITISSVQPYDADYTFNHHPHITKFNGILYVFYSQGAADEDSINQRIVYSTSEDGVNWSPYNVFSDSVELAVQHPLGFFNNGEKLYAYYCVKEVDPDSVAGENGVDDYVFTGIKYYYKELINGQWSDPVESNCVLGSYENVKYFNGYYYATTATGVRRSDDGINWQTFGLTDEQIGKAISAGAGSLSEGTVYMTNDFTLHLLMRGNDGYIWHSISTDMGENWSNAYRTNLTNDNSKLYAGRANDGRYFLVNNPVKTATTERTPLCISISSDGYNFDTTYIIRDGSYDIVTPGQHKGGSYAYPSCYLDGNILYVVYSAGKEIIEVSSFNFEDLFS